MSARGEQRRQERNARRAYLYEVKRQAEGCGWGRQDATAVNLQDGGAQPPQTLPEVTRYEGWLMGRHGLQTPPTGSPRQAWLDYLAPRFSDGTYVTLTFADTPNDPSNTRGLNHPEVVTRHIHQWLSDIGYDFDFIFGIEPHAFRDILHAHGILSLPTTPEQRDFLQASWATKHGYAKVLPVTDNCVSYVTKYALKGSTECWDWRLS